MKIGVMNDPRQDIIKEINWISENEFDFVDLTIEPSGAYDFDVGRVKKALDDTGLDAVGHTNPFLPAIFPISSIRKVCLNEFKKYVEIFSELGIELMNVHPYYDRHQRSKTEKFRANLELLKNVNGFCKSKGMTLMLENYIEPFDRPSSFLKIIKEVPDLKILLDIGHANLNQKKNQCSQFLERLGDRIVHIHLSDNRGISDDHLPPGCGTINWKEITTILKKNDYDGTITLEVFSPDRDYLLFSREKLKEYWNDRR
jgi:sugar phosphate isomerase/epimerase